MLGHESTDAGMRVQNVLREKISLSFRARLPTMGIMGLPFLLEETLLSQPAVHDHESGLNGGWGTHTEASAQGFVANTYESTGNDESVPRTTPLHPEGFIGHYEIIRKIGQGGMGGVFLARDHRLGRFVAVKVLHAGSSSKAHLLAEARATAQARHENIVVIYDVGEFEDRSYMVLEYLSGQTLRQVLSASQTPSEPAVPVHVALDIVIAVSRALAAAHRGGIIHRDLKPENIMVLDSGQVKVLDFGLARSMDTIRRDKPAGTFAYMAPEQWLGHDVDERSDIWALGMVLFELLSGTHPLAATAASGFSTIADLTTPMPSLRDVCPDIVPVANVVARCLRKRKEDRYVSADELIAALESCRQGLSAEVPERFRIGTPATRMRLCRQKVQKSCMAKRRLHLGVRAKPTSMRFARCKCQLWLMSA